MPATQPTWDKRKTFNLRQFNEQEHMGKDNSMKEKKRIDDIEDDTTFEAISEEHNEFKDTPFSGVSHAFDEKIAAQYGVELALLISHFRFWVRFNRRTGDKKNMHVKDGRCWTYQSRREIQAHFSYWNYDHVKYLCEKLVALGVLITANFNRNPTINRTLWYAFADEKYWQVDEASVLGNSKNVYEGQKCPTSGKSAPRRAKVPKYTDTESSDTKTTNNIYHIGPLSVDNSPREEEKSCEQKSGAIASNIATFLLEEIRKRMPKFKQPNLEDWATTIDRMIRIDKRESFEIMEAITWMKNDDWFAANILSADNLRKNFDKIQSKMMFTDKKSLITQNREYAIQAKNKYPKELKGLMFNERCAYNAFNTDSAIEAFFDLPHETFKNVFSKLFGGEARA